MNKDKRYVFTIGEDYEPLRKLAIADDRSVASYLRKIIKKAIKDVKEGNNIIKTGGK